MCPEFQISVDSRSETGARGGSRCRPPEDRLYNVTDESGDVEVKKRFGVVERITSCSC